MSPSAGSTFRTSLIAIAFCAPSLLGAQRLAADTAHPAYESLRYKEDWSRRYSGDPFDPLKHIDLFGDSYISLGGSARMRGEKDQHFLGGGTGIRDDQYVLSRVYMHADIHGSYGTRVFLEGRNAEAPGRNLPGGQRASDRDDLDWGNIFGEIARGFQGGRAVLRYGRQEMLFGRERMISPSDWSNVRRSFQGTVLEVHEQSVVVTGMYVHPIIVSQTDKNHQDDLTTLLGAYATFRRPTPSVFELYVLDKRVDETATAPKSSRTTIGVRVVEPFFTNWTAELEGGTQTGSTGNATINASMITSDFTRAFKAPWSPSLTLGADRSSGTGAGKPALTGTWDVFYALGHSYLGYADVLGRRNVTEFRAVAQAAPIKTLNLRASGHLFRRTSADDGTYDTGGAVSRASAPGASMAIGSEIDVTAQWKLQRHLRLDGGGAVFTPGQFMKDTGTSERYLWMFASLAVTF